jgi:hypothetical protein
VCCALVAYSRYYGGYCLISVFLCAVVSFGITCWEGMCVVLGVTLLIGLERVGVAWLVMSLLAVTLSLQLVAAVRFYCSVEFRTFTSLFSSLYLSSFLLYYTHTHAHRRCLSDSCGVILPTALDTYLALEYFLFFVVECFVDFCGVSVL